MNRKIDLTKMLHHIAKYFDVDMLNAIINLDRSRYTRLKPEWKNVLCYYAAKYGNQSAIDWILTSTKYYNIHFMSDIVFRTCCINNHIDMAIDLYKTSTKIDTHSKSDEAFRSSCKNGNLELVIWLYNLDRYTNIFGEKNDALYCGCSNGYLHIVLWLYSIIGTQIIGRKSFIFRFLCTKYFRCGNLVLQY